MTIGELLTVLGLEMAGIALAWVGGAYVLKTWINHQNEKRNS